MKILFDHQIFSVQRYGGISRYFVELMRGLHALERVEVDLALRFSDNFYIHEHPDFFDVASLKARRDLFFGLNFRGRARLNRLLEKIGILNDPNSQNSRFSLRKIIFNDFDVFHPTYYDPYFLRHLGNKPFVLTVYDMIHELFRERFPEYDDATIPRKKELITRAAHIIAISQSTKNDIMNMYNIDEKKISVIYLGNSLQSENISKSELDMPSKYILYVGDRQAYKNFGFFLKAIKDLLIEDKNLQLVCAGSVPFNKSEQQQFQALGLQEKLTHFPLVDDATLLQLYKRASCFAFPSLYEGFGIPVLEAMTCGCPALLSNRSSLPEIGGDAARYFDPEDQESIADAVRSVLYDEQTANQMRQRGYERAKQFTWAKCAEETRQVYEAVANP
jgi:glycosyltransferase involved in cell wall biosynthesis